MLPIPPSLPPFSPQGTDEAAVVTLCVQGDGVPNVEEGGGAIGIHLANV